MESGRQSLQPLMLAYAFDSFAVDGKLGLRQPRRVRGRGRIAPADCVAVGREPVLSLTRSPAAETADRVTVGFVRADLDYVPGAVEALAPDAAEPRTEQTVLPIVLSEGEAGRSRSGR